MLGASRLALGGAVLTAAGPFSDALAAQKIYQWGSASLGSTGYVIITALAAAVNKFSEPKLRNSSLSTAGGAENMALIGEGVLDFAQTTSTDWLPATKGTGRYKDNPVKIMQMFSYTAWNLSPMVRADSGIKTLADLAGKKIMPASAGGATTGMWHTLFKAAGLFDKVNWTYGSWTETYGAIKSGAADCIPINLTNGRNSPLVTELEVSNIPMRVLDIPEDVVKKAQALNPGLLSAVVQPGGIKFLDKPTRLVTLGGILGVHPRVDAETAYNVTKTILDNADFIRKKGVQLQDVSPEFATQQLIANYPVHPGAARYLKEKGVWRDDLTVGTL
ncbi:MAG: TAXI family TRAP transporter solute-binding subunit [Verrucomicrobia bacterium]|nr:TAXI family TRAP transporter solute-binding subunit [Verrucomicrobiota bacterium]